MKINDVQSGDKLIFQTTAGREISDLLDDYVQAILAQRRKYKSGSIPNLAGSSGAGSSSLSGSQTALDNLPQPTMKRAPAIAGRRS